MYHHSRPAMDPRPRRRRIRGALTAAGAGAGAATAGAALLLASWGVRAAAASSCSSSSSTTRPVPKDNPILLSGNQAFPLPRLQDVLPLIEPARSSSPGWTFHALRAVTLDPSTGKVHWVTDPCGDDEQQGQPSSRMCLGSLTSVQLLLGEGQACRGGDGIGFSLDPEDPRDPLGKFFQKRFFPEECADRWSDLLPGAVLFQADWDLKMLLHNVNGVGDGLGAWYQPIEALYRQAPVPIGEEVLAKVWLAAEAVEVAEAPLGLALGKVTLRLRAAAVRREPASPTGLVEDRGKPPPRAVALFVNACNAHMAELVAHLPSFGFLQQLVLAQEAARFLRDRGVALPVEPGLAALRSPLTGTTRVPAVRVERTRLVTAAGVVGVKLEEGAAAATAAAVWLRGLGAVSVGVESTALVVSMHDASGGGKQVWTFSCGVRNATLREMGSHEALCRSAAALDCKRERGVWDQFGGAEHGAQGGEWAGGGEDGPAGKGEQGQAGRDDACEEALAVWAEQLEAWRVWPSRPLAPPPPRPTNELLPVPLGTYNVSGRLVLLDELAGEEEEGGSGDDGVSAVVLLAWAGRGQAARAEAAARRLNATGLLLVKEDDSGQKRRKKGRRLSVEEEWEEDAVLRGMAARMPVRLLAPEMGEELRAMARLSAVEDEDEDEDEESNGVEEDRKGLRLWLACGVEREVGGGEGEEAEQEEDEGPRELMHEGVEYRTLDLAVIDSSRDGCQREGLPIPPGFEIAPAYPDVVAHVVAPHTWGTAALLLRATDPNKADAILSVPPGFIVYATATQGKQAGGRLEAGAGLLVVEVNATTGTRTYRPLNCDARVLLRRTVTTVAYAGYEYAALDQDGGGGVDTTEVPAGAPPVFEGVEAAAARLPPGEGWEISPADRGIAQRVVASRPWGTDVIVLADGKGYPTQLYYYRKHLHKQQQEQQQRKGDQKAQAAWVPHYRFLIRRPLAAQGVGGDGRAAGGGYRVGDAYRADASARLRLRRLGKGHGERGLRYLLEVEVTERVMIHGGVDLTAVRRVPLSDGASAAGGAAADANAQVLEALEHATAKGELGHGGVWREGGRTYSVLSMAGLDDGEEDE